MPRNPLAFAPAHPDARPAATVTGGLYGNALTRYIRQRAQQLGIDPLVPLAVAPHEGGFAGAVGDQGTSYGPFQLHVGGALPAAHVGDARSWANSPAGVDYALGQLARTLGGRRGIPGVQAAITGFERPAAQYVPGEIGKATATYQQLAATPAPSPAPPPVRTPTAPRADFVSAFKTAAGGGAATPATGGTGDFVSSFRAAAGLPPPPGAGPSPLPIVQPRNVTQPPTNYPLAARGKVIGVPYKGTHTLYGNWESDNAVDLAVPTGTPVVALQDGTIGPQIGPLNTSGDPRLTGLRVHLVTPGNEYYYAHLSRLTVKAGQKVKAGQVIGYSGAANGVQHLHFAERAGNPLRLVS